MPMKTIPIRFTDPEVPFETASELLSYIAFPLQDNARRRKLATALCRFVHRHEMIRDPVWGTTPQLVRPVVFSDEQYEKEARKNLETILKRLSTAVLMLLSDLVSLWSGEPSIEIFNSAPNSSNIAKNIAKSLGKKEGSESTIRSKVWAPTRPVSHLAFCYYWLALKKRWEQESNLTNKRTIDLISPYPDKTTLLQIISDSEKLRFDLFKLRRYDFSDDNTIKFVITS
jgi:hypothetical protein